MRAALVVESRRLSLEDISTALGRQPDVGHDIGAVSPSRGAAREWSSWALTLSWGPSVHAGTEGLSQAIEALGPELAARIAPLRPRGCDAVLSVVQELSDEAASTGLHLTPSAVAWLASAGACLDVDQYLHQQATERG